MDLQKTPGMVVPDKVSVKTIGILNIVFSLGLIAGGLCINFYALMIPFLSMSMVQVQERITREDAAKAESLAKIDAKEKKATPEEKIALAKQRDDILNTPPRPEAAMMAFADPRLRDLTFITHFCLDLISGFLLNFLMLVSGVGLLYFKSWGRYLAVGVAWMKVVRLILVCGSMAFLIAPFVGTTLSQMETESLAGDAKIVAEAPQDGAEVRFGLQACAFTLLLVGSIYPMVTIRVLGSRGAKAAVQRVR